MSLILLAVIYLVFISLGLPDSFIGSCWPAISNSLLVSEGSQGIVTITVCLCTIISAFLTAPISRKFSTFQITSVSILLTVSGLIGAMFSKHFIIFVLCMIPLGLGAGAIDSVLNNYVAINYKSKHLHFLHAFWSVGAIISPIISAKFLMNPEGWRNSLFIISILQVIILLITVFSRRLWKKDDICREKQENCEEKIGFFDTFKIKGVIPIILAFFFYTGAESLSLNWFASMMVFAYDVNEATASSWVSFICVGYIIGRFLSGFISSKISDKNIIRIFASLVVAACILLFMPFRLKIAPVIAVILGMGLGPVYPAIIHDTPNKFTTAYSSSVMSVQIGCAYIAMVTISPLFGLIGERFGFSLLPIAILVCILFAIICSEISNYLTKDKTQLFKK